MSTKHAIEPRLDHDYANKVFVDCENPLDKHCNDSVQSTTAAPSKVPYLKRFYNVIKSYLAVIIPNKHVTERLSDKCLNNDSDNCENHQSLSSISRNTYDQVFITDNDEMYQWASKNTYMFRLFKCLEKYSVFRLFLAGLISINPCWRSVLWVDNVINKSESVEITDTLILHCNSIETYSKVIPRICGSYNRLTLHGHMSWDQIKQLIHPGVKQVRINAKFEIEPEEYGKFVCFMRRHCRGRGYKFSLAQKTSPGRLIKFIDDVWERTWGTHILLPFKHGYYFIHYLPCLVYVIFVIIFVSVSTIIFELVALYFSGRKNFGYVVLIIDCITVFFHVNAAPIDVKNKV